MRLGLQALTCGCVLSVLIGCQTSPAPPTEEDAQTAWHHIAAQTRTDKLVELVSLKRTNGQFQEVHGTKIYTFSYEAKVRYLTPVGRWKTGDVQTIDSDYGFLRTENGWQGPDGIVYPK